MKNKMKLILLGLQHVFAMVGATVLVPLLTGLNVGVALVASGVGTLIYILCTKGKVPMYLGSSFAYIAAISAAGAIGNFNGAFTGIMIVGLIYVVFATIIAKFGSEWLKKLLPPIVVGPMIIIIGMSLAGVAITSSGFDGASGIAVPIVATISFISVVVVSIFGKGFIKVIPFLIAIVIGYITAAIFGIIDFSVFSNYTFFQIPDFAFLGTYKLDFSAVLIFAPLALVTMAEHIGDHSVLSEVVDRDLLVDPGLHRTLLGDGIATFVAGAMGGPANTSYGENIGVVAMTKVDSAKVTGLAAIFAIILGFLGYLQAFVYSIPGAVIGGMTIILYGLIAASGVRVMVKNQIDLGKTKNLIIASTMLVIGLGGAIISIGSFEMMGMSLAMIVGIILNKVLPE
jgi:uracil permease